MLDVCLFSLSRDACRAGRKENLEQSINNFISACVAAARGQSRRRAGRARSVERRVPRTPGDRSSIELVAQAGANHVDRQMAGRGGEGMDRLRWRIRTRCPNRESRSADIRGAGANCCSTAWPSPSMPATHPNRQLELYCRNDPSPKTETNSLNEARPRKPSGAIDQHVGPRRSEPYPARAKQVELVSNRQGSRSRQAPRLSSTP